MGKVPLPLTRLNHLSSSRIRELFMWVTKDWDTIWIIIVVKEKNAKTNKSQVGEQIKLILSSSKVMVLCTYMRHLFLFLGPMIVFFCCKPRLLLMMVLLSCCQHNNMLCETGVHEHHLKRLNDMEKWPLIGDSPCTCDDRASNPVSDKHCNYR